MDRRIPLLRDRILVQIDLDPLRDYKQAVVTYRDITAKKLKRLSWDDRARWFARGIIVMAFLAYLVT